MVGSVYPAATDGSYKIYSIRGVRPAARTPRCRGHPTEKPCTAERIFRGPEVAPRARFSLAGSSEKTDASLCPRTTSVEARSVRLAIVRPYLRKHWPRVLAYALVLLFTGRVAEPRAHRAEAKRTPQVYSLHQRAAALPQSLHVLSFRSAALPAGGTVFWSAAVASCDLCSAASAGQAHSSTNWRPTAPRPPPLPA